MIDRLKVLAFAKDYVDHGFYPDCRPACANFVSHVLNDAGWGHEAINYVPAFFDIFKQTMKPQPGDLVIFKQTYDAVPPAGIGEEDDKTHVGIYMGDDKTFAHYSSTTDSPALGSLLSDYYAAHFECFLSIGDNQELPKPEQPEEKEKYGTIKLFVNDKGKTVIIDGQAFSVVSIGENGIKYKK